MARDKASLRRQFRHQRLALLPAAEAGLQAAALQQLPALLAQQSRPGYLGIYWPLAGEADLRVLAQLPALLPRLALPRIHAGALHYRPWQPGTALSPDDCGIPAPAAGPELEAEALAVLLAPALAVDRRGLRLGYGGGWFDRLRSQSPWRALPALAVLPAGCVVEELPGDGWDVPFDGWLDEQGLHWLQAV